MNQLNAVTDAFVLKANNQQFTCIRMDVLHNLRRLGDLNIYIANESLEGWGYSAEDIAPALSHLGLDWTHYRYRDEAVLNTKQLQALINLYLSFKKSNNEPEAPSII